MLDFAINAGKTAIAGVIISGFPNCSINAKMLYGVHATKKALGHKFEKKKKDFHA
jgi:hypothetical protein